MKNRKIMSNLFSRVSTAAVLLALITLSVFQYQWVKSSAEKDLIELYKNISFRIYSAISEEFSYYPLFSNRYDDFKNLNSESELRSKLTDLFAISNNYDENQYINSISYIRVGEDSRNYFSYSSEGWRELSEFPIDSEFDKPGPSLIPDSADTTKVWIFLPLRTMIKDLRIQIVIHFDLFSFYKNNIEQKITTLSDVYELKWHYKSSDEIMEPLKEYNYIYSPFKVLKNKFLSIDSPKYIEVPLHVIMFNVDDGRARLYYETVKDRHIKQGLNAYVSVYDDGIPLIQSKEYNLTLQWILSLLLLLGIGIAYLIILYQINRLKQLRLREKEFVATVTHELRTPLTVIHSAADNIKSGIVTPERIEQYGHLITDQSARLSSMIEGILLFSRLEGKVEQSPITKNVYFNEIEKDLQVFSQTLEKDFNKRISIDFGSLAASAVTDRDTIELILTNLISNSAKHAYNLKTEGEIRVKGHVQLPHTLIFTVEDDGAGIEKSEKKHIFEPFFRGDHSFKNQIKGSGLGLYLSFRKAKLLGGSLYVKSPYERADGRIRKGSRFTLTLPYHAGKGEDNS